MRAVWLREFGGPEVLVPGEAPDPVPGPGQVLVEVVFANTTFVETQFRAGAPGPFRAGLPVIPGNGVGGVISGVGEGVDPGLAGQRVVTSTGGSGGYAERVAVDAAAVFEVPPALSLDAAVALLADGRTATGLVHATRVRPGDRVLVEAAAGGVGGLLVQLAKAAGATVIGAAGGPAKVAHVRGADAVADYLRPDWTASAGPVDVVFDGVGGEIGTAAFGLLRPGGRMAVYGLAGGSWAEVSEEDAAARGVSLVRSIGTPAQLRAFTESALAAAATGSLVPVIGQRFPLEKAADAHAAIESRATVGKTLLVV
ncbi:NADPH:quinone reductase and related Zn-dependent oxidoreductase [Amycolatopsis mediterranei S699]|uniref:NADPH:quinone reductase and related Zn-dependent oxidoreductase n=4 Tax=Amycolatopsis mediterranei TaxID=33910 RepID=A0A0H3DHQ0_AMYMU|nr:zinc-binding dehydrogenase [Amycolatopsis mediterranei]ADJ49643.1 NADPH:quinone reductase and related Zn-dependent oxidoreductase [Amycolatopsis mediterranei U32]AEK46627.1 NADPH:quinone reductase and related Zn-dependent oxidoreductase [Amycolatopsis mediterranei S699]AFO81353.1 NADPH:quinone reductase and related Zn-dependent oxidoreductase [Amycolatopsis mediterranei S699]AGT88481.1 NADPH:quinone reductase-related Zn-dependent oxidoreductase [Amycolatopsis mediterranei RB]KDO08108.1 NADP